MRLSQEELDQERTALRRIMAAERRRRNELRNKAALYGLSADPAVGLELEDIARRLKGETV